MRDVLFQGGCRSLFREWRDFLDMIKMCMHEIHSMSKTELQMGDAVLERSS